MKQATQTSESLAIGLLLALTGGFLDAYTYLMRGGVFANTQTGNIVLLGINLFNGNFSKALEYLIPLFAFFVGIFVAEWVRTRYQVRSGIHWRQIIVIIEAAVLCLVAFIPGNACANAAVAFVCSLQVDAFRKLGGSPYATTMCTGNLRSATEHLYHYNRSRDRQMLYKSLRYFAVIGLFILGAGASAVLSRLWGHLSVLVTPVILLAAAKLMSRSHAEE